MHIYIHICTCWYIPGIFVWLCAVVFHVLGTGMECDAVLLLGFLITVTSNSYYFVGNITLSNFLEILNSLQLHYDYFTHWYSSQTSSLSSMVRRRSDMLIKECKDILKSRGSHQDNLCRTQMKLFWNSAPFLQDACVMESFIVVCNNP